MMTEFQIGDTVEVVFIDDHEYYICEEEIAVAEDAVDELLLGEQGTVTYVSDSYVQVITENFGNIKFLKNELEIVNETGEDIYL